VKGGVQLPAIFIDGDPKGMVKEFKSKYSIERPFSGMVLWCEAVNSPKTIRRIWANEEVILDISGTTPAAKGFVLTTDPVTGVSEGPQYTFLEDTENPFGGNASVVTPNDKTFYIRNYPGNCKQNPDPDLELIHGVGKVPAYRECTCSYIKNLNLEHYDYALPNLRAEVVDGITGRAEIVEAFAVRAGVPVENLE
jgi:hypothetical protein